MSHIPSAFNVQTVPRDYPRIYLFGDSLTERAFYEQDSGFGWKLREYYADRVHVVNSGAYLLSQQLTDTVPYLHLQCQGRVSS